jgi:hypothetical protein
MKENHISKPSGVPVPTEIVGVRFKEGGKVYHFAPSGKFYPLGLRVVVDTASGEQIGDVASENKVSPRSPEPPLKPVLREATADDIKRDNQNRLRIADLRRIFNEKIAKHNLPMTPTEIEVAFDGNKVTFYFSSPTVLTFGCWFATSPPRVAQELNCGKSVFVMKQSESADLARVVVGFAAKIFCLTSSPCQSKWQRNSRSR